MAMNLKQLETLALVAELGSLSRAARTLGVAQSLVSRGIGQLEAEWGDRLFERTGRGVVLSEFGRRVMPQVELLLAQSAQSQSGETAEGDHSHDSFDTLEAQPTVPPPEQSPSRPGLLASPRAAAAHSALQHQQRPHGPSSSPSAVRTHRRAAHFSLQWEWTTQQLVDPRAGIASPQLLRSSPLHHGHSSPRPPPQDHGRAGMNTRPVRRASASVDGRLPPTDSTRVLRAHREL